MKFHLKSLKKSSFGANLDKRLLIVIFAKLFFKCDRNPPRNKSSGTKRLFLNTCPLYFEYDVKSGKRKDAIFALFLDYMKLTDQLFCVCDRG